MELRPFGASGLTVSAVGFGADHIGDPDLSDSAVQRLLGEVLDSGVTLVDTARGYRLSEPRIGRWLAHRREEYVLSTKVGYGVPGLRDWSGPAVTAGIERALRALRTDVLDVCFLHSCARDVLARGEAVAALHGARDAGKVLVCGYSGEGEALRWAIESRQFGAVQTSVNLADQWSVDVLVPRAVELGMGVVAKRPLANAAWRFSDRPTGRYEEPYWERLRTMALHPADGDWVGTALRFSVFAAGVSTAIVGTSVPEHLNEAIASLGRGPLPADERRRWRAAFGHHGSGWQPQI